jgi:hypothetical protein
LDKLPADRQKLVRELQEKYQLVGMTLAFIGFSSSATRLAMEPPTAIDQFKGVLKRAGIDYSFSSIYFRDLAHEIAARAQDITDEFNAAFGSNIFA